MALPILWPDTLPGPSSILLEPAERRHVSTITDNGLQQVAGKQTDYLADESVRFRFDATQAEIFQALWKIDLLEGGAWFAAQWPCAHYPTGYAVRRFKGEPAWKLIGHEYWEVSCKMQIRGRGVVPAAGGTRLYDLLMLAPQGNRAGPLVRTGTARHENPFTAENDYAVDFRVVLHNTETELPAGVEVRMSLVATKTNPADPAIDVPVYADFVSTTSRFARWNDSGLLTGWVNTGTEASKTSHLYAGFTYTAHGFVDGVDVGQIGTFLVNPDELFPTGISPRSGYAGGQCGFCDFSWSSTL